ncbi:MAG: hypothetical protein ACOYMG_17685 [Candidatus Methylumidiphilus sp.]
MQSKKKSQVESRQMTQLHLMYRPVSCVGTAVALALLMLAPLAQGQSVCSSDEQPVPKVLLDRFINADCDACWSDPSTAPAPPSALALDWIVPGRLGEDAALSTAASRDALTRLNALQLEPPDTRMQAQTGVTAWPGARLRVAHGMVVGEYIGASIELTLPPGELPETPWQAWLVLVETLPLGLEGSTVPRNLVRNVLQTLWDKHNMLSNSVLINFKETRPMNIPAGANAQRLRVVGWIQDNQDRVRIVAQSFCLATDKD